METTILQDFNFESYEVQQKFVRQDELEQVFALAIAVGRLGRSTAAC
ncbi:MAG: hypothetical protein ACLQM6_03425 [Acidobacteriaceae bacterium]